MFGTPPSTRADPRARGPEVGAGPARPVRSTVLRRFPLGRLADRGSFPFARRPCSAPAPATRARYRPGGPAGGSRGPREALVGGRRRGARTAVTTPRRARRHAPSRRISGPAGATHRAEASVPSAGPSLSRRSATSPSCSRTTRLPSSAGSPGSTITTVPDGISGAIESSRTLRA